jgi:hypothetical protein
LSSPSRRYSFIALSGVGITIVICAALYFLVKNFEFNETLSKEEINEALGVAVPTSATNVTYTSNTFQDWYFDLRFEVTPNDLAPFTDKICEGVLFQAFNPFDTLDSAELHFGNTCHKQYKKVLRTVEILVDQTDPTLSKVRIVMSS